VSTCDEEGNHEVISSVSTCDEEGNQDRGHLKREHLGTRELAAGARQG
jgi:hypothetical protein